MTNLDKYYLELTLKEACKTVREQKGGPFGALIVLREEIISIAGNTVLASNDPTAHAEINVIRQACAKLNSFQLEDCTLYASCEPCPMCFGAIYWARPARVVFAATRSDASKAGFDDTLIYQEIIKPIDQRLILFENIQITDRNIPFDIWNEWGNKKLY